LGKKITPQPINFKKKYAICYRICMTLFCALLSSYNNVSANSINEIDLIGDSTKQKKSIKESRFEKHRKLQLHYYAFPNAALNFDRFQLISDYTHNEQLFKVNSEFQNYIHTNINTNENPGINNQLILMKNQISNGPVGESQGFNDIFNNTTYKNQYYATLRANLVNVNSEAEINQLIKSSTSEMISNGMGDLSNDLLPFITMLMNEQHINNYDFDRAVSTKPTAKGIVTAVEMLNTMGSLDPNNKLGVCRDTHDMGLRVLRNMYRVYLDEKYPGNNYNVDDYVFLQAWVTHSSQHITLVVVDPENPRDFHELDWGRVIKKTDQEGVEIGKMVGPAIRLWQFDEDKNKSVAFNLIRSQWGMFFDKEILDEEEQWQLNGIYSPQYSSGASYKFDVSKKSKFVLSAGMMNAKERYLSGSIRSGKHNYNLTKYLSYDGFASWQSMYINDTQRKTKTMAWSNWDNSSNLISSVRYISGLETKHFNITPNLQFHLYAKAQLEVFLTLSYFDSNDEEFHSKLYKSGDGNIWTTWGAELTYTNDSKNFETTLNYNDRNFLIPSDVRLLSPNPFVLIENATSEKSGQGTQLKSKLRLPKGNFEIDARFEQDALKSKFIYSAIAYETSNFNNIQFFAKTGYYDQIDGIEYYWYTKGRLWIKSGVILPSKKLTFSVMSENVQGNDYSFSTAISKSF